MNNRSFNLFVAGALTLFVALGAVALLFVVSRQSVLDAREVYQGVDKKYSVLRGCIQDPRAHPCGQPEIAASIGRASWQAFATVDFLTQILYSMIALLGGCSLAGAYLAFTFLRKP